MRATFPTRVINIDLNILTVFSDQANYESSFSEHSNYINMLWKQLLVDRRKEHVRNLTIKYTKNVYHTPRVACVDELPTARVKQQKWHKNIE